MPKPAGKIYLVPTPIGNLDDITKRALIVLNDVDIIACEDTRLSGRLLKHFNINKKLISYHDFNETRRSDQLKDMLSEGSNIAVITDAGSPGISDPAYRVVKMAVENEFEIIALPGPTALIPALTVSGLPTDRFFFEGFLPNKSGARKNRLQKLKTHEHTLVFYESPHRIEKSLNDILEVFGNRKICLSREISKKFEEHLRGGLEEIIGLLNKRKLKGEMVIIVEGFNKKDEHR